MFLFQEKRFVKVVVVVAVAVAVVVVLSIQSGPQQMWSGISKLVSWAEKGRAKHRIQ